MGLSYADDTNSPHISSTGLGLPCSQNHDACLTAGELLPPVKQLQRKQGLPQVSSVLSF